MKEVIILAGGPNYQKLNVYLDRKDVYWIGVDRGAYRLLESGVIPDIAVGDFDSLSEDKFGKVKSRVSDVRLANEAKDETDTELALMIAIEEFPELPITLLGVSGGRLDHFMANFWMILKPRFSPHLARVRLADEYNTISFLQPGEHILQKEVDKTYLAFLCMTPVTKLSLYDAKYQLNEVDVAYPVSYASNEFIGETTRMSFQSGIVSVIQSKDH